MNSPSLLVLVGFMGSGKSTVGPALAQALDTTFVDLDQVLETESGLTIRSWFAERGEADFRAAERAAVAAACRSLAGRGGVIALGGGAYSDARTRSLLASCARTIWLDAPLAVVTARVPDDGGRPLFGDAGSRADLYARRAADYAHADLRIDASGPVEQVVSAIRHALADLPPDAPGDPRTVSSR